MSMAIGRAGAEIEFEVNAPGERRSALAAYLATPASNHGRGILVIHDEWGLTDFIRDACDRLARAGFVALAPDLFRGRTAGDRVAAQQLAKELDADRAAKELGSAMLEIHNQSATTGAKIGALGFGMGGQLALLVASRERRLGAVVDFYGEHSEIDPDLTSVGASVLAILADRGEAGPESERHKLESTLRQAQVRASIRVRDGARSGYMDDSRSDVHDAAAAAEGWDDLLAFFRSELG